MAKLDAITKRSLEDWKLHCEQIQNSTTVDLYESKETQEERKKRALRDYNYYVKTYFSTLADSDCADFHVDFANKVLKNPNKIGVAEWPREHAKSMHVDVFIPMWLLMHNELTGMILMGKNSDDACNLLSDIQAQLQFNQLFIHDWGEQYNIGDWQAGNFTTKSGIRFLAIGRDQSPRGARKNEKRPNYGVIDDVDDDELVNNLRRVLKIVKRILGALFFALSTKRWRMVIAGNRIHNQSVLAHIVGDTKPKAPKREGLIHSKVYAIDPKTGKPAWHQRYSLQEINEKVTVAGIEGRREFFHENHVEGTIFKDNLLQWKPMPKSTWHKYTVIIGYCDPSFEDNATSDWKAVNVWAITAEGEKHLLKRFVRKCDMGAVYEFMSDFDEDLPPGVGVVWFIEKQFFNRPIQDALAAYNMLRKKAGKKTLGNIPDLRKKENKYTRIIKMQPDYALKKVYYNLAELHNTDMIEGNNQLKGIEPGYKSADDSPDADEGAWYFLDMHKPGRDFKPTFGKRQHQSLY